jgi:hypothetical protein
MEATERFDNENVDIDCAGKNFWMGDEAVKAMTRPRRNRAGVSVTRSKFIDGVRLDLLFYYAAQID